MTTVQSSHYNLTDDSMIIIDDNNSDTTYTYSPAGVQDNRTNSYMIL